MMRNLMTMGVALLLAGCVTAPPALPPVLQASAVGACTAAASTAGAVDLTPKAAAGTSEKIVTVSASSACLAGETAKQGYAVFALPTTGLVASLSAGAIIEPKRVLAPSVATLSGDGRVVRTFAKDDLQHRGRTVSVLFKPKPEERFVIVAADAASVGGQFKLVTVDPAGADAQAHKAKHEAGLKIATVTAGAPYSFEGEAFARVYFADPAPPAPKPAPAQPK